MMEYSQDGKDVTLTVTFPIMLTILPGHFSAEKLIDQQ